MTNELFFKTINDRSVFLYSYWPWILLFIIYEEKDEWYFTTFIMYAGLIWHLLILLCYFQIQTYFSIWSNLCYLMYFLTSLKFISLKNECRPKDLCLKNHNFVKIAIRVFISTVKMVFRIMYDSLSYVLNCDYYF